MYSKYKFISMQTGEVVTDLKSVFKSIWRDLTVFHFLNLNWRYRKQGW